MFVKLQPIVVQSKSLPCESKSRIATPIKTTTTTTTTTPKPTTTTLIPKAAPAQVAFVPTGKIFTYYKTAKPCSEGRNAEVPQVNKQIGTSKPKKRVHKTHRKTKIPKHYYSRSRMPQSSSAAEEIVSNIFIFFII